MPPFWFFPILWRGHWQCTLSNGVRVLSNEYTFLSLSRMLTGEYRCCCCNRCYCCCCCCYTVTSFTPVTAVAVATTVTAVAAVVAAAVAVVWISTVSVPTVTITTFPTSHKALDPCSHPPTWVVSGASVKHALNLCSTDVITIQ